MLLAHVATVEAVASVKPTDLDSPAAAAIRKLPKDMVNAPKPKRFSVEAKRDEDVAGDRVTEEILVRGEREPEDVLGPRKSPMQVFREKLERDRPMTPKEKTQLALCFIGLCAANYGPDGAPVENMAYSRAERGAKKSTLELSQQFRGTLQ